MRLSFTHRRPAVVAAAMACSLLLIAGATTVGADGATAATTTTVAPKPSTTTTGPDTTTKSPATTTTREPTTTSTPTVTSSTAPTPTTPVVPTAPGPLVTTTTVPQHVVNQPNLNALVPHIDALRGSGVQYQASSRVSSEQSGPGVPSYLNSPGGPYLYDSQGRVVILHGVNVVYKHAPYIAYPDAGKPWNLSAKDAAMMRSLGFNVVRLGLEWQGLEPGSGGPNQPKVCTPGTPGDPHEFNRAVALRYLTHVRAAVALLARYGIYTLLDMHQDVYNKNFRGEGAPDWAVCTNNVPIVPKGGRWSNNYSNPTLQTAVQHFWSNDVVGDLQGNYDHVWATVADYFKNDRWVAATTPTTSPSRPRRRPLPSQPSPASSSASTPARATPGSWPTGPTL